MTNMENVIFGRRLKITEQNGKIVDVEVVDDIPADNEQYLKGSWQAVPVGVVDIDKQE